jgi:hypothetical protein
MPPRGGPARQPWTPDQASKGVTCPACGLANEAGARTCRNCGLPIASASDPLRGVTPGRVDLPRARRSGISATVGFVMVVGLLLVGGTLAVSGGGILSGGGRLGGATETPTPELVAVDGSEGDATVPLASADPEGVEAEASPTRDALTTSLDYTCEDGAIKDLSKGRWFLNEVQAGIRPDSDQVYWNMTRQSSDSRKSTVVRMEWMTPKKAQQTYGIQKVLGKYAVVITFDGPVDIPANQRIDTAVLEAEGIEQIKKIQLFEGKDGNAIGLANKSCAKLSSVNWNRKSAKRKNGRVTLDFERFTSAE